MIIIIIKIIKIIIIIIIIKYGKYAYPSIDSCFFLTVASSGYSNHGIPSLGSSWCVHHLVMSDKIPMPNQRSTDTNGTSGTVSGSGFLSEMMQVLFLVWSNVLAPRSFWPAASPYSPYSPYSPSPRHGLFSNFTTIHCFLASYIVKTHNNKLRPTKKQMIHPGNTSSRFAAIVDSKDKFWWAVHRLAPNARKLLASSNKASKASESPNT